MKLVVVSDTHGKQDHDLILPEGDVLVHCGDLTMSGNPIGMARELAWLELQPHRRKLIVPGNHDFCLEKDPSWLIAFAQAGCDLLIDAEVVVDGLKFWGYPWVPDLPTWAFYGTEPQLQDKLELVPRDTDILIAHGPPQGCTDFVDRGGHVGNGPMREAVVKGRLPKTILCGHIHEGYGEMYLGDTHIVNASTCDARYQFVNAPIELEL